MRSQTPVGLFAAIGIMVAGTLAGMYTLYSRPNLAGRATEDLMREIVSDANEHSNEPYAFQLLYMERQRFLVNEVARRTPLRLARLRMETEAADLNSKPNRVVSMANPAASCP